jgi:LysM repeat protein
MLNRKISPPILSAVVLSLALVSTGRAQVANPDVSGPVYSTPAPTPATTPAPASHTGSYTVVKGDSLTSIARKFNTTRKKLRALNNIDTSVVAVKPGEVLLVPASAAVAKAKSHHAYLVAQPVQDFDVPASTFASCPVPLPTPGDDPDAANPASSADATTDETGKPAPIAKLVSPSEMAAQPPDDVQIINPTTPPPAPATEPAPAPVQQVAKAEPQSVPIASAPALAPVPAPVYRYNSSNSHQFSTTTTIADVRPVPAPYNPAPPAPRPASHGINLGAIFGFKQNTQADDWGSRFFTQARALGNEGIEYDGDWRPPGEAHSWTMDCSNTTRYLYKVTAGLELPRTASDQYYYLHLQNKAWDVPLNQYGFVDTEYLRQNLKPGDLLFWENTYRPERQPPITHVMVYLGTNTQGQWIMAGSQSSRGGEHNRRNGGPDIYVFRPSQPCGGYTTWMGLVHHQGRFCAFGRPLEADPTKLSVAANE